MTAILNTCQEHHAVTGNSTQGNSNDAKSLLTVKQFCRTYPWPSESAMRSYIYRAEELGISDAFVRVRRRVLILPIKFFYLVQQLQSRSNRGGIYETTTR